MNKIYKKGDGWSPESAPAAQAAGRAVKPALEAGYSAVKRVAAEIAADYELRAPVTVAFDYGRLNSGVPIDSIKIRNPLKEKTPKDGLEQLYDVATVNAQAAINKKLSALEKAQKNAVKIENLPDGRIRYYLKESPSIKDGPTRGSSYVTEYTPHTGQARSWQECYDHSGKVNRIHPKMINGQDIIG